MALTIANIITNVDQYIGDATNNSVSAAERLQYITEATVWLQEELQNDIQTEVYELDYLDTVHTYRITATIPDVFNAVDLRLSEDDQYNSFTFKSSREVAEDIGQESLEDSYTIERHDDNNYLVINHESKYGNKVVSDCESLTSGTGTWAVAYDGTNLHVDDVVFKEGGSSLAFDVEVSLDASATARIYNDTFNVMDLSEYNDGTSSWVMWVYIPETTNFSSISLTWADSSLSSGWSNSVTTDINGNAFVEGWNKIKVDWRDYAILGTPDATDIVSLRIDFVYGGGYTDVQNFRIDDIKLIRGEELTFYYTTWSVGTTSAADDTKVYAFSATTNVPFFSGQYDQYKYAVAHKAAALIFKKWREREAASTEDSEASQALDRARNGIPSSITKEEKAFKSKQLNFNRRKF